MSRIMNLMLPSCEEVSRLTSQAMDETMPLNKRLRMKLHLLVCKWCRRNDEQLRLMRELATGSSNQQIQKATLSNQARDRISRSLRQDDQPS